jgi:Txe/YoeB family toxin of Txe-Axe toxin-antitoxin module
VKEIEFTKAAENALTSLDIKEQDKAMHLLQVIASNITDPSLTGKINKLIGPAQNIFAIRLNLSLRIIIELHEDRINVVDILNHDLFERYFKKGLS